MGLLGEVLGDLRDETADLQTILRPLTPEQWEAPTPAAGWAVRDQVGHLAWFDDAAVTAVLEPETFTASIPHDRTVDDLAAATRHLPCDELLRWFTAARARSLDAFATLEDKDRVPWYGPAMSAVSFVTARLMETWAHGQDVADALGLAREPTPRLRHVAQIGVRALPYSFLVRGLPVPTDPVRVELVMPDGAAWAIGPDRVEDVVSGPMLDFCLLVTQRVHRDDTALTCAGETANAWLSIAQAFAGPPGKGRAPSGKPPMA
ncbi:TIGR03084 family metal-binding protein [Nonomuraea longicatena]|uniref:TIGR03084 family metal-binding protein n=1 Tax=Nonomuraea longicatena TaxID=83682 RepID=A0ABN1NNP7_9ACTN